MFIPVIPIVCRIRGKCRQYLKVTWFPCSTPILIQSISTLSHTNLLKLEKKINSNTNLILDLKNPSILVIHKHILTLYKKNDYSSIANLFEWSLEKDFKFTDIRVYEICLESYLKSPQFKVNGKTRLEMISKYLLSLSLKPNLLIFNLLMKGFITLKDMDQVRYHYNLLGRYDLTPNTFIYTTLLNAFAKAKDSNNVEITFKNMLSKNIIPNEIILGILIDYYSKFDLTKMKETFELMEYYNITPNIQIYNSLIRGYGKTNNFEQVEFLFQFLKSKKFPINLLTYTSMIHAYGVQGYLEEMKLTFLEMKRNKIRCDLNLYTIILQSLSKFHQLQDMEDIYQQMISDKISPDLITYTVLIHGFGRQGMINKMELYYQDMMESDIMPTLPTYSALIQAYGLNGYIDKMEQQIEIMNENQVQLDSALLIIIFKSYIKVKNLKQLKNYYLWMIDSKLETIKLYHCIINGYGKLQRVDQMEWIFNEMIENGYQPNQIILDTMVKWFDKEGMYDKVDYYDNFRISDQLK
ncbi:hypothetical protein BC833DRAFT_604210 [Globomyces pollinis-pini]|nr:hypothetical protein BC833DRAFT_604210 [Globomyces pollinis-pini]